MKFFNKKYFFLSGLLLGVEVLIAIFFKDSFVRPLVGDYLVVILLYCMVRTITSWGVNKAALVVLLFAYCVEALQWLDILKLLGLKRNLFTDLTLGSSFDWGDIVAYTLGLLTVLLIEEGFERRKNRE